LAPGQRKEGSATMASVSKLLLRSVAALAAVGAVTVAGEQVLRLNALTVGFTYLVVILAIASAWGFVESVLASIVATLCFNYFFFAPVHTFNINDPQDWVAVLAFLTTALIGSRLSTKAEQRARDAMERQQDLERLYSFSRTILLIEGTESFPRELIRRLAEIFELDAALLYDRRSGETYQAGPGETLGLDEQVRDAALGGSGYLHAAGKRTVTAVRLGAEPIAGLALEGGPMGDAVLQGIANLVAIGLERARAQDLHHQIEAARQSEQLRTSLIDAMAHEFKTPLTSVKAATTSLLADPEQPAASRHELLTIADEEADHLRELIDDAVEMARLDMARIDLKLEWLDPLAVAREVVGTFRSEFAARPIEVVDDGAAETALDRRLARLALRQLLDNAIKYSPPDSPVTVRVGAGTFEVSNRGKEIPASEQRRIFDRFYRGAAVKQRIPGSGLGLSIAHAIAKAHGGELAVESAGGETTFRLTLPRRDGAFE
jgi:two-component system, OmpR family, sensor histidine kinase KdpD